MVWNAAKPKGSPEVLGSESTHSTEAIWHGVTERVVGFMSGPKPWSM